MVREDSSACRSALTGAADSIRDPCTKFAEETKRTLEVMQNAIRVLALGIDFRRFSRFERFTPEVLSHHTGDVALHQHFRQAAM